MRAKMKIERARELLQKAIELGCVPSNEGSFVVFRPPLPIDLLIESGDIGDEIASILEPNPQGNAPHDAA